jgi:hypothetical protein
VWSSSVWITHEASPPTGTGSEAVPEAWRYAATLGKSRLRCATRLKPGGAMTRLRLSARPRSRSAWRAWAAVAAAAVFPAPCFRDQNSGQTH